jgi:hypothetical protein
MPLAVELGTPEPFRNPGFLQALSGPFTLYRFLCAGRCKFLLCTLVQHHRLRPNPTVSSFSANQRPPLLQVKTRRMSSPLVDSV